MGKLRFVALATLCLVAACGQKGPLYIPVQEPGAAEAVNHEPAGQSEDMEEDEAVNE